MANTPEEQAAETRTENWLEIDKHLRMDAAGSIVTLTNSKVGNIHLIEYVSNEPWKMVGHFEADCPPNCPLRVRSED